MREHVTHQTAGFLLYVSIGMVVSHGIQGCDNAAVLGDVLLCPMMHAQCPQCAKCAPLDFGVRMMMIQTLDNSMHPVRVGDAFFVSDGSA